MEKKIASMKDNVLSVDFGGGNIVSIQDYDNGEEAVKVVFANQFKNLNVGENGAATIQQSSDFTALMYLHLSSSSDENGHFQRWVAQMRHGEVDFLQATLVNKSRGLKLQLTNGVVVSQPPITLGSNEYGMKWVVQFLDSKMEVENA